MARGGRRTFMRMMSTRSWLTLPRSWYFTIGIWMPSEKMSVVMPPSTPPTSSQCAMQQEKPASLPLWKIGRVKVKWLRWLPVM